MKKVDWAGIEPHYRAGVRALLDIGKEFGVSDAAIIKHAKKNGWVRDLSAKIKARAEAKVSAAAVSAEVSAQRSANEREIVEANAEMQKNVILAHREDIGGARDIASKFFLELRDVTGAADLIEQLRAALADEKVEAKLDALDRIAALPGRAGVLKSLTESLKNLIMMERQAFGIKDDATDTETYEAKLRRFIEAAVV
jgi:hypothetical protein